MAMDIEVHSGSDSGPSLDLHIAEYEALMTRNTYLVTLQFSLWPILLLFFTLLAQIWNSIDHGILIWSTGVALQLIGAAWVQLIWEQLNNIQYLESKVRPLIAASMHGSRFWQYESYLAYYRGGIFLGDYWLTLAAILALSLAAYVRWPLLIVDYAGLVINACVAVFLTIKTIGLVKLRRRLSVELSPIQMNEK